MKALFAQTKRAALTVFLVIASAVSLLAFSPAAAQAQSGGPGGSRRSAALEQSLVRLQDWNTRQEINLRHAATAGEKLEKFIERARNKGLDTAALEEALGNYHVALADAKNDHDSAAAILASHAGFDDAGKVTDAQAARQTLESARKALNDAHVSMLQAYGNLRAAINDWRDSQAVR